VSQCGLIDGVAAPGAVLILTGSHAEDDARCVAGAEDDVVRAGWAVHEIPLPQRPLLPLDDQERLAGEHEEVLLVDLPVVHPHQLAGAEHEQVDPNLGEVHLALERQTLSSPPRCRQRASRALRTNQPSPLAASPCFVCSNGASGTIGG
jgi:hypothetical protein